MIEARMLGEPVMKRMAWLLVFVVLPLSCVFSQQASAQMPPTKEAVEKLFATMHIREQIHNAIELTSKQSREMAQNTLKKRLPELTQKDLNRLNDLNDRILRQVDLDGMIDDMVPVYQRHLSREDVAAIEAFYETPTGQKFLREQPAMTAEAMQALQPRMEKMMNSVMEEVDKMTKEGSTAPKPPNGDKN